MSKKSEYGIFFIHGAGLNGRIWQGVTEQLNLPFVCADYSSLYRSDQQNATLNDYINLAHDQASLLNTDKIIIVAHSIGGVIGVELIKRLGDRVAAFIGVSAAIPEHGKNFISTLPFPQRIIMPILLKVAGTKPPEAAIRQSLCVDLNKEQAEKITKNYKQESIRLFLDKTSSSDIPHTPAFYIKTLQDKEFSPKVQDKAIKTLASAEVFTIDSGHMPMVSHPELVSQHIKDSISRI